MVLCHVHTFHLYILLIIRPKRRWIEEVERELKGMGVKDWKRLALKGTTGRRSWRRPRPKLGCGAGGGTPYSYCYLATKNVIYMFILSSHLPLDFPSESESLMK